MNNVCMADPKDASFHFCKSRWSEILGHHHDSICSAVNGLPCRLHPDSDGCYLPPPETIDLGMASPPGGPFSTSARTNCKKPEDHDDHSMAMDSREKSDSVIAWVKEVRPLVFVTEAVRGMECFRKHGVYTKKSPLGAYTRLIAEITGHDGNTWYTGVACVATDSALWVDHTSERPGAD